jgi:beta-mannosidase
MFIAHRVNIKQHLSEKNTSESTTYSLSLFFPSTYLAAKAIEERELKLKRPENYDEKTGEYGKPITLWNGVSSRCYVRKAQYGWGWDWGPIVMTVGPWKDILLEAYAARVDSNRISVVLDEPYDAPKLESTFEVVGQTEGIKAGVKLVDKQGRVVREEQGVALTSGGEGAVGRVEWSFKAGEVDIWWPVGHGAQPLYTLEVTLKKDQSNGHSNGHVNGNANGHNGHINGNSSATAQHSQKFGFRSLRLVQEKLEDAPGTSFLFQVNGRRIFCGGSNWIPADNFLTQVTPDRYRAWLELMVAGNQNMVRVWAGGIYEPDVFYDLCDELGLLVWQDFMFGCAIYPAFDDLVASVEEEAKQVVKRLRNHPSLAIFAGNNEDYQVAEAINLEIDYDDHEADFRKTAFPA